MNEKAPNPGDPAAEITFLDYLRNSRLGRNVARSFSSGKTRGPSQGAEAASGRPGRLRSVANDAGLGALVRLSDRVTGKTAPHPGGTQGMAAAGAQGGGGPSNTGPQEPGPAEDFESVGSVLKRSRESYEEDLPAVARTLNIRLVYLQAIEDQRYERLPGPAYAVGFIRAYSDYLGLDSVEMVRRFKIEVEGLDRRQELFFPVPVTESKVPGGAVILVSLLLVVVAYGAWFYLTSDESQVAETVPPVPEELGGEPSQAEPAPAAEEAAPAEAAESEQTAEVVETASAASQPTATEETEDQAGAGDSEEGSQSDEAAGTTAEAPAATGEGEAGEQASTEQAAADAESEAGAAGAEEQTAEAAEEGQDPLTLARVLKRPADLVAPPPSPAAEPDAPALQVTEAQREAARQAAVEQARAQRAGTQQPFDNSGATDQQPLPGSAGLAVPDEGAIPAAPETTQLAARTESRTPQVFGAENETTRIVLRATQDSWVQIRDGNDNLLMTRVLRRGDEYRVPDQNGLTMLTGNAGGIEIVVDGAALSPLGPVGAVRRNIQLDPERLLEGTALQR